LEGVNELEEADIFPSPVARDRRSDPGLAVEKKELNI